MIVLSFVAALLMVAMLCVVIDKYGVPDMVSSIYYLLGKRGWVFQVVLIAFGAMMMVCLLDSGLGEQCLAFLACEGLMFVGMAPRFLEESDRGLHKGAAIVAAVASVGWCMTVDVRLTIAAMGLYGLYWACKDEDSKPWFVAETSAILLVMVTYWCNVLV
jgi:hypothetical protein